MTMEDQAVATRDVAQTPYARRARYNTAENGFAFAWPAVPARQFLAERDRAFAANTPTGMIPLDQSSDLTTSYPATTPTLLARYIKIRAGESLRTDFVASGELYYVMHGAGESSNAGETIVWVEGDVFCFPGGATTVHNAAAIDCLLFVATNEPLLSFEGLRAPAPGKAVVEATHWPAQEINRQFEAVWQRPITPNTTGHSVQFTSAALAPSFNTIPTINSAINSLAPGADQRPHRHNGVAITLAIHGEGIFSKIDGQRVDWSDGAAMITPAAALHSHHNRGTRRMRSLVIQDEGLHHYTRTAGFSFD
jgi:gentisate 1,2-dioxygenase